MKTVIVFFFIFVGILAETTRNVDSREDDMTLCLVRHGLDPGPANPTEDQKNCYYACMFATIGYMKKDGTFNLDLMLADAYRSPEKRAEGKRKLDSIVSTCTQRAGDDVCKLAGCYQELRAKLAEIKGIAGSAAHTSID